MYSFLMQCKSIRLRMFCYSEGRFIVSLSIRSLNSTVFAVAWWRKWDIYSTLYDIRCWIRCNFVIKQLVQKQMHWWSPYQSDRPYNLRLNGQNDYESTLTLCCCLYHKWKDLGKTIFKYRRNGQCPFKASIWLQNMVVI